MLSNFDGKITLFWVLVNGGKTFTNVTVITEGIINRKWGGQCTDQLLPNPPHPSREAFWHFDSLKGNGNGFGQWSPPAPTDPEPTALSHWYSVLAKMLFLLVPPESARDEGPEINRLGKTKLGRYRDCPGVGCV